MSRIATTTVALASLLALPLLPSPARADEGATGKSLRRGLQGLFGDDSNDVTPLERTGRAMTAPRGFTSEDDIGRGDFESGRLGEIFDHFESGEPGTFAGVDDVPIAYRVFRADPETKGAIVIATGWTEGVVKYAELIYDLRGRGYSVYAFDHRGQGMSGRMIAADEPPTSPQRQKSHVRRFDDWVADLATFVEQVVKPAEHEHVYALAHSMGAAITTRYIQTREHPFDAVAFSAPLYEIQTSLFERLFVDFQNLIGRGRAYARGRGPRTGREPFAGNRVTNSETRHQLAQDIIDRYPEVQIGGPTYRWVQQVLRGTKKIRRDAARIDVPMLLFQAGDEQIVSTAAQDLVVSRAPGAKKVVFAGARHEIFQEVDAVRDEALRLALEHFEAHAD